MENMNFKYVCSSVNMSLSLPPKDNRAGTGKSATTKLIMRDTNLGEYL